jgi:hypothetical protein
MAVSPWAQIRQGAQPDTPPPDIGPWAPVPKLPPTSDTPVTARPTVVEDPLAQNIQYHQSEAQKYRDKLATPWGSPTNHPGKLGKVAHIFSEIGNIAGNIVAPNAMATIPGTQLYNQEHAAGNSDLADKEQEQLSTEKSHDIAATLGQQKLAETTQHHSLQDQEKAHSHGMKYDESGQLVPLEYEELPPQQQALVDLKGSQDRLAQARSQLVDAQKNNLPQQMELARQRIDAELAGQKVALQRLGIQREGLDFQKDKFYNPQPTGTERKTGDLAESAVNQVHTLRGIIQAHPEIFGPGSGRSQRIEAWLGTQSPETAAFNASKTYLAEHSAGVFGGRGKYIIQELNNITRPESNPEALNAALDVAENTAQHFVGKGQVHHAPGGGNTAPALPKVGDVVDGFKFKGGDAHKQENWEKVTH